MRHPVRAAVVTLLVVLMVAGIAVVAVLGTITQEEARQDALQPDGGCAPNTVTLPAADGGDQGVQTAARAALRAGWTGRDAAVAVAVAGAESTYDPEAANASSTARGMWQIMLSYHQPKFRGADWRDPYANARVAHQIWSDSGWQPWVAHTSGAYQRFMPEAEAAVEAALQENGQAAATTVAATTPTQQTGLRPPAQRGYDVVRDRFAFTGTIGGYADRNIAGTSTVSKHALGLAIDVMTSDPDVGDPIAEFFAGPGYEPYGVENVIWRGRIFNAGGGWRAYSHPSGVNSVTLGHYDHVHVDFREGGGTGPEPVAAGYTAQQCIPTATTTGAITHPVPQQFVGTNRNNWGRSGGLWADLHTGTDYSAPCGTPVLAAHAGTVQIDRTQSWAGPALVKVSTGPSALTTWYAHMESVSAAAGQVVTAGQQIGTIGSEGNSTGCHLHFEVHPRNGSIYADNVDPTRWLAQNVGQVSQASQVAAAPPASQVTGGVARFATVNVGRASASAIANRIRTVLRTARPDVVMLQEVRGHNVARMIAAEPGNWQTFQPQGKDSVAIVWNADRLQRVDAVAAPGFNGPRYARVIPTVELRDAEGRDLVAAAIHMPPDGTKSAVQRRLYDTMMRNYLSVTRSTTLPVVVGGDWNAPLNKARGVASPIRASNAAGMVTNWQRGNPCSGTKGRGKIDGFTFTNDRTSVVDQGCLPKTGSDHNPMWLDVAYANAA